MSKEMIKEDKLRKILIDTGILQIEIAEYLNMFQTVLVEKRNKSMCKSEKRKNN